MKHTEPLYFLFPLLLSALACTLTAKPTPTPTPQIGAAMVAQVVKPTQTPSPAPTPTKAPQTCKVSTGLPEGRLNLRACGGIGCAVVAVLSDGDSLTLIKAGDWAQMQTGDGLTGYVNSKFVTCER